MRNSLFLSICVGCVSGTAERSGISILELSSGVSALLGPAAFLQLVSLMSGTVQLCSFLARPCFPEVFFTCSPSRSCLQAIGLHDLCFVIEQIIKVNGSQLSCVLVLPSSQTHFLDNCHGISTLANRVVSRFLGPLGIHNRWESSPGANKDNDRLVERCKSRLAIPSSLLPTVLSTPRTSNLDLCRAVKLQPQSARIILFRADTSISTTCFAFSVLNFKYVLSASKVNGCTQIKADGFKPAEPTLQLLHKTNL